MGLKKIMLIVSCGICLTGCYSSDRTANLGVTPENVSSSCVDNYHLYETTSKLEYLAFLKNFDHGKYEVINIDTGYFVFGVDLNEYYMVTYKTK